MATYLPIYSDTKHIFASSDSLVHYTISDLNDNILYEGSAYRQPGQEKAFIYINRLVASHINIKDLPGPSLGWNHSNATFTAVVKETRPGATIIRKEYNFVYNWDYESGGYDSNVLLNFPSTNQVSPADYIPISIWLENEFTSMQAVYTFPDGTTTEVPISTALAHTNDIDIRCIQAAINKTALISSTKVAIQTDNQDLMVYDTTSCNRYSLYYRNKRGGMDIFPLNGGLVKSEDFDRTIFSLDYMNSEPTSVGKKVINTNIKTKYTATTKFLTDEQAARFAKHFLSSPDVVLYDNVADETYSVILEEDSADYKTFKSNGRQLNQYTFTFSLTHTKKVL